MKCSSRHTLALIDSNFGGPLPPLYPGMFTVALSEGLLPSLHPLSTSLWAVGLILLTLQGFVGLKYELSTLSPTSTFSGRLIKKMNYSWVSRDVTSFAQVSVRHVSLGCHMYANNSLFPQ